MSHQENAFTKVNAKINADSLSNNRLLQQLNCIPAVGAMATPALRPNQAAPDCPVPPVQGEDFPPENPPGVIQAIASLSIGLIAISFAANFIKLSEYELSPNSTIFNRLWIATVVLGLWKGLMTIRNQRSQYKFRQPKSYTPQDVRLLVGFGAFFAFSQLFWAWSLTETSVAISTVLHNLTPVFTSLGAWLLFGRHYDCKFAVGMVIAIAGVSAIGLEDLQIASGKNIGDLAAVLSAVLVAMYMLVAEQLRTKLTATTILFWGSGVAAFVTFPVLLFTHDQFFPSSWKGWLCVIALALICQILGQGLIAHSLSRLTSGFVATAFLLDPVLSSLEAWVIFSEQLSFSNWLAFVTVLMGIYLAVSSQSIVKPTNGEL